MNKPVTMTLEQVCERYDSKQKVYVLYNGEKIFFGVVGAIAKFVDEYYMNKLAHVYNWKMNDHIEIYIQK